jgi:hypothetical protein
MAASGKGRKIGSNSRRAAAWWKNGGPTRHAVKAAKRHGCGNWRLHDKGGEHRTTNFNPAGSRAKRAAEHHGCGEVQLHKQGGFHDPNKIVAAKLKADGQRIALAQRIASLNEVAAQ